MASKFFQFIPNTINYDFIGFRKKFMLLSGTALLISFGLIGTRGLNFGLDFRGGTEVQIEFTACKPGAKNQKNCVSRKNLNSDAMRKSILGAFPGTKLQVQQTGNQGTGFLLKFGKVSILSAKDKARIKTQLKRAYGKTLLAANFRKEGGNKIDLIFARKLKGPKKKAAVPAKTLKKAGLKIPGKPGFKISGKPGIRGNPAIQAQIQKLLRQMRKKNKGKGLNFKMLKPRKAPKPSPVAPRPTARPASPGARPKPMFHEDYAPAADRPAARRADARPAAARPAAPAARPAAPAARPVARPVARPAAPAVRPAAARPAVARRAAPAARPTPVARPAAPAARPAARPVAARRAAPVARRAAPAARKVAARKAAARKVAAPPKKAINIKQLTQMKDEFKRLAKLFAELGLGKIKISKATRQSGDHYEYAITFAGLSAKLTEKLNGLFGSAFKIQQVESVGPSVGKKLREDGIISILLANLFILIYISIRFDFRYAPGAVAALLHDVFITTGLFSLLQLPFDLAIIAALLTIIGYSLNDTIVVYDRIRENWAKSKINFGFVMNRSINETLSRTLLTSITTFLAVVPIYIIGGSNIKWFAFAMMFGILIGTYSSIAIASPLVYFLDQYFTKKERAEDQELEDKRDKRRRRRAGLSERPHEA